MILAGDIGGTKTVVALFDEANGGLALQRDETFPSGSHVSLEEILQKFLAGGEKPTLAACCFGVAGAVIDGKCRTTNLPWELDENALAEAVNAPKGKLLNDLEAAAYGMLFLGEGEFCVLNQPPQQPRPGNIAVIAAGTGLGEALLYWDGTHYHPLASEGGHCDLTARTDLEIDLFKYLRTKYGGHVSAERVLSGPGFFNVYTFLRDSGRYVESPELAARLEAGEGNGAISELGLNGSDPLCVATLDLFATAYGAEAGNLALKGMAVSGVYVGGGIAPKMLSALQTGLFMQAFSDKGRFSSLMRNIPVKVALNPRAPLIGAANYARRLSESS